MRQDLYYLQGVDLIWMFSTAAAWIQGNSVEPANSNNKCLNVLIFVILSSEHKFVWFVSIKQLKLKRTSNQTRRLT